MSVSHRRVAHPPYLRRKPPHVAGQLLQLVHCDNHSLEGPLQAASKRGRGQPLLHKRHQISGISRVRRFDLLTANATRQGSRPVSNLSGPGSTAHFPVVAVLYRRPQISARPAGEEREGVVIGMAFRLGTLKCPWRFRCHHLIKVFYAGVAGWTDQQMPDGTIILTA
jgi:hypothetical protein